MKNTSTGTGIMEKPPQPDPDELAKQSLSRIKTKIMIMSGKGGVGKSSVSVNLDMAPAEKGFTVGLMDVDIHGPDIPRMLGRIPFDPNLVQCGVLRHFLPEALC